VCGNFSKKESFGWQSPAHQYLQKIGLKAVFCKVLRGGDRTESRGILYTYRYKNHFVEKKFYRLRKVGPVFSLIRIGV